MLKFSGRLSYVKLTKKLNIKKSSRSVATIIRYLYEIRKVWSRKPSFVKVWRRYIMLSWLQKRKKLKKQKFFNKINSEGNDDWLIKEVQKKIR